MAWKKKINLSPAPLSNQLSQDELEFLRTKVDKTLLLLDTSTMPAEVKTAWVTLLPRMTLEQVDRLCALVEEEIAIALKAMEAQPENDELFLKLKAAKELYDAQTVEINQNALAGLHKIEENIFYAKE